MELKVQRISYRPEIDGLRAIAVSAVVIFHAFPALLRGGFVGVDIFFVISGYLITKILADEAQAGGISILNFYGRRIRRIMPAFLVVMFVVAMVGAAVLLRPEVADLSLQIVASTLFSANVFFWLQSGYFDAASLTKPLLHIWSLGVEEQFYLLWPLVLVACGNSKGKFVWAAAAIVLASLVCNVVTVEHHGAAAFFLPFSRLWELAVGAFLATKAQSFRCSPKQAVAAQLFGLALICLSIFVISEKDLFPGWWALMPVLGAAFIIGFGGANSVVDRYLSVKWIVFIGLLSYPIYLWHWPLLSFLYILSGGSPSIQLRLIAVVSSVLLAWLTYMFVERPVRKSLSESAAFSLLLPLVAISMAGVILYGEASTGQAFSRPLLATRANKDNPFENIDISTATIGSGREWLVRGCGVSQEEDKEIRDCYSDNRESPRFAIWGDSHADALMPGLLRESTAGARWVQVGAGGCPPLAAGIVRVYPGDPGYDTPVICTKANVIALRMLERSQTIKAVLLVTASRMVTPIFYSNGPGRPAYEGAILEGLGGAAKALRAAGKDVYFLIDNPTFANPKECVAGRADFSPEGVGRCMKTVVQYEKESAQYRKILEKLKNENPFVKFINGPSVLCRDGKCAVGMDGKFLYTDGDHLSDYGNGLVARLVIDSISMSTE